MSVKVNPKTGVSTYTLKFSGEEIQILRAAAEKLKAQEKDGSRAWYVWDKIVYDISRMLK